MDAQQSARARIVYFRVVEPDYPRNRRIRSFLTGRGHDVVVVPPAVGGRRLVGHLTDLLRLARTSRRGDVIIVAEQYLRATPIAAAVARLRGCRLVVDAFVGIHETAVEDWGVAKPGSLRARRFRLQDWFALRAADCVLIDTDVRADALRAAAAAPSTVLTLPVGAPGWARPAERTPGNAAGLRVLYYGNYIPLHGIDTVLDALARTAPGVRLTMLGEGGRRVLAERKVRELGLEQRVTFRDAVAESELAAVIHEHDVVLGVFGSSAKAASVIANKTWQGLAAGRIVVTRRSPALDELAPMVGPQLIQVDVEQHGPEALAAALDDVAARPDRDDPWIAERLEEYVGQRYETLGVWLDGGVS